MLLKPPNNIRIPEGVTEIGTCAFSKCSGIKQITVPDTVTSIGGGAFEMCSSLESLRLPKYMPSIPVCLCYEDVALKDVNIPQGITSIERGAFEGCPLPSFSIPEGVTYVGDEAFMAASSLKTLDFPRSLTTVGTYAFNFCRSLTDIYYAGTIADWNAINFVNQSNNALASVTIHCTDGDISGDTGITISNKSKTVVVGKTVSLTASGRSDIKWKTSNKKVATVTSAGKVKGVKAGTAVITAYSSADPTVKATCKVTVVYGITYKLNGGTNNSANPATYNGKAKITLKNPTRKGYTFKGWYSNSKLTKKVTYIAKGSSGNKTFYAKWEANKYYIKYNGNGATKTAMTNSTATYDKTITLKANTYKLSKYTFKGWALGDPKTGKVYKNQAKVKNLAAKGTVTLYARWGYKVRYAANNDTATAAMPDSNMLKGHDNILSQPAFNQSKGVFTGWNTKADGTGTSYAAGAAVDIKPGKDGTVTLYAQWVYDPYPHIAYAQPDPLFFQHDDAKHPGDCAIASCAVRKAMMNDRSKASAYYDEYWAINGYQSWVKSWAAFGLTQDWDVSLENIYNHLKEGPVIVQRYREIDANNAYSHFSVIYAYVGDTNNLQKSGFLVYDVKDEVYYGGYADNLEKWDNYRGEGPLSQLDY